MLDSRMTEDELYYDKDNHSVQTSQNRRPRGKENNVFTAAVLNNSYDDLRSKTRKRRVTTTHRRETKTAKHFEGPSRNQKTYRNKRSVSTRSTKNKPNAKKSSRRIISDSISERSNSYRGHDRSLSMSFKKEKHSNLFNDK